jgi:hypothetical protein
MLSGGEAALLDALLGAEGITAAGLDIWATNETNAANSGRDVLPLYTDITAGGPTLNICTNSDYDTGRTGNKLAESRFLRISVPTTGNYNVSMITTTPTPPTSDPPPTPPDVIRDQSDPDIYIYREGTLVASGRSPDDNSEVLPSPVSLSSAFTYVVDIEEWRYDDQDASSDFPEQICFAVTFAP